VVVRIITQKGIWGSQWKWTSLKETGINCWEVLRDKFPLTVVSDLKTLAPVLLMLLLGISDTASNMMLQK
jgi:hypothetical protein